MKLLLAAGFIGLAFSCAAHAQDYHYVAPHYTDHGSAFVPGHYQTNSDGSRYNNWSTQGNSNPFTGQAGTVNPYTPSYSGYTGSSGSGHRRSAYDY